MLFLLASLVSNAGGGGVYVETTPGAAWTDSTGPVTRGVSAGVSAGAFWGPYKATLQYGRYTRAGLNGTASSAAPFREGPESVIASLGPEFGGGIDLLKAGAYWRIVVAPALFVAAEDIDSDDEDVFDIGVSVRASGAGVWWVDRRLGVVARIEGGPNYRLDARTTFTGGIGIGLIARIGFVREKNDEPADVVFDPELLPWEDVPDEGAP